MKSLILLAVAAAAFYAYTNWMPSAPERASAPFGARSYGSNPVREIERAPNALIEMRGSMAGSNAGVANAARRAVSGKVGR